ncbi:MAG: maturase [Pseudonocardiales bacterium]|nr:MAG: maturase [Pseudonocardiales bacterium]
MYLLAYGRLYSNKGAMTPGPDGETVDGMSLGKIERIIDALRHERYRFKPARRTYIPKKNGKKRPLGLPSWSDKLVGEVIRLLLEAYYEPQFSDLSHGYRPNRGCHTALSEIAHHWTGTTWFIEADIADCFGSIDHEIALSALAERIHDSRFLRLLRNMLQAGYLEDWIWHATLSGAPQGGVVSPILSNIYLHKLDSFVEKVLIPEYTRGGSRAPNPEYREVAKQLARMRRRGDRLAVRALRKQMRGMPSKDPADPRFRRLRYVRYCDDHLLGFTGPKAEAEAIKIRLATFLREELKLELSQEKTLITHARTGAARFLSYEITVQHADHKVASKGRSINGIVGLRVPRDVIKAKCSPFLKLGKPERRNQMVNEGDHTIVRTYGAEYRGLVEYYLPAGDVYRLNRLEWVMKTSMLKTLACKHNSTVTKMADRYKTTITTPYGPRRCFEARVEREGRQPLVARFGGIPLRRTKNAILTDRAPRPVTVRRKELVTRLQAGRCELCKQAGTVDVHHVSKLADLENPGRPQPAWDQLMAKRRRKTLVVCAGCHTAIHNGQPTATPTQ